MIITRTPFRISFFGGGTDFPDFFREYGGAVLSTTFDKYCYVTVRHLPPFFEHRNEIIYSKIEHTLTVDDIEHPAIREAMKFLNMHDLHLAYEADLPARTGLGTSSSFAVGMLHAFHALKSEYVDKRLLADEAIYLERTLCGESGGVQDQIAASFGGLNRIDFNSSGYAVNPIIMSEERKKALCDNLMLFYTGVSRFSFEIQDATQKRIGQKTELLQEMLHLVDAAQKILSDKQSDLDEFGKLLDRTWNLKKGVSSSISSDSIDALYQMGMRAGALGGKLLGAGGGGFLLFYVPKERQEQVRKTLNKLLFVPFSFENEGTKILYFRPETLDHRGI